MIYIGVVLFNAVVCRLSSKQEKANWIHGGSSPSDSAIIKHL